MHLGQVRLPEALDPGVFETGVPAEQQGLVIADPMMSKAAGANPGVGAIEFEPEVLRIVRPDIEHVTACQGAGFEQEIDVQGVPRRQADESAVADLLERLDQRKVVAAVEQVRRSLQRDRAGPVRYGLDIAHQ
ncbi:hypothetical protein [Thalassobaculum sp.]|uniref:hypothetical protein n=1 Tax=Thalassobaculum sp. TaxID=2022740 RepID=UPI0032EAE4DF